MAKKRRELTPEEIESKRLEDIQITLNREWNEFMDNGDKIPLPMHKDRIYSVGQRVQWGNHDKSIVVEVSDDNRFYKIETTGIKNNYGRGVPYAQLNWQDWTNLLPYISLEESKLREVLSTNEDIFLRQSNTTINSFYSMVYRFGVDFDVDYQRDHVWNNDDMVSLIDSIMNNIDIGKFLFIHRPYEEYAEKNKRGYEILDGKQRLTTIMKFYESRFQYKGKYYHELSVIDQCKFHDHPIAQLVAENLTERQRIELFIKFNTTGKVMDQKHIEMVKAKLEEIKSK